MIPALAMLNHATRESSEPRANGTHVRRITGLSPDEKADIEGERKEKQIKMKPTSTIIENSLQSLFSTEDTDGFKSTVNVNTHDLFYDARVIIQKKEKTGEYTDEAKLCIAAYTAEGDTPQPLDRLPSDQPFDMHPILPFVAKTIKEGWLPIYRASSKLTDWTVGIRIHYTWQCNQVKYTAVLSGFRTWSPYIYTDRNVTITSDTTTNNVIFRVQTLKDTAETSFKLEKMAELIDHINQYFKSRPFSWNAEYNTQYVRMEALNLA